MPLRPPHPPKPALGIALLPSLPHLQDKIINSNLVILGRPGEQNKTLLSSLDSQIGAGVGWEEDKRHHFWHHPRGSWSTLCMRPPDLLSPLLWGPPSACSSGVMWVAVRPWTVQTLQSQCLEAEAASSPFSHQPSAPRC